MKRRLICLLTVCTILLSIVAIAPLQVRAASNMKTSNNGIFFIKNWEGFSAKPYKDGSQYTVGYGTKCPDDKYAYYMEHGITEAEAEALLASMLAGFEAQVNAFIDRHSVTFSQQQFDAVVSLVFNCGSNWLKKGDTLKRVLTKNVSDNELIYGLTIYSMANGVRSKGHIKRRLSEANIYLNGVYQVNPPSNYRYVRYDACGGTIVSYDVQGFDANQSTELFTTATYAGYKFLGWYTEEDGGEKVDVLDSSIPNGKYLYAHWEELPPATEPPVTEPPVTEPPVTEPPVTEPPVTEPPVTEPPMTEPPVTEPPATEPPVTEPPVTEPPVTEPPVTEPPVTEPPVTEPPATEPPVTEPPVTEPPATEPPVTEPPVTEPPVTEPPVTEPPVTEPPVTEPVMPPIVPEANGGLQVTVVNTGVNIRKGPGTGFTITGTAKINQKITVTATATNDGYLWGQFEGGWICLKYTDYETVKNPPVLFSGTIYNANNLNIREKPGTAYSIVGKYHNGDRVEILETKTVGAVEWGRTDLGWISLDYIKRDGEATPDKPVETPTPSQTWTGTVATAGDALYIRSGAGTYHSIAGYLPNSSRVTILERKTVSGKEWGRIDKGWICLDYVKIDGAPSPTPDATEPTQPPATEPSETQPSAPVAITMTVNTCSLRIRKGAGNDKSIVDYLPFGETVVILETKTIGAFQWGRTAAGWVNMQYLK